MFRHENNNLTKLLLIIAIAYLKEKASIKSKNTSSD